VAYPNSGQVWDPIKRGWVGDRSANRWEERATDWYARGAEWIGGCCGTTPEDIQAMRAALKERFPRVFEERSDDCGSL
jgi:homocysteine S-methyltransferase